MGNSFEHLSNSMHILKLLKLARGDMTKLWPTLNKTKEFLHSNCCFLMSTIEKRCASSLVTYFFFFQALFWCCSKCILSLTELRVGFTQISLKLHKECQAKLTLWGYISFLVSTPISNYFVNDFTFIFFFPTATETSIFGSYKTYSFVPKNVEIRKFFVWISTLQL